MLGTVVAQKSNIERININSMQNGVTINIVSDIKIQRSQITGWHNPSTSWSYITIYNSVGNTDTLNKSEVNRAEQTSFRTEKGNAKVVIRKSGGKDAGRGYSIKLKDIDTSVMTHIKNVMKPRVREANETLKIPVFYGNEERWKAVRKRGVLRDKNGSLILPLIMFRRTDVAFDDAMPMSFDHDVRGEFIKVTRSNKWSKDTFYFQV